MNKTEGEHFDVVVIGAGMSGLAAGIRLALFGKKVLLLERHNVIGGLNSFYSINGRKYDVGLHAMTNYAPGVKSGSLNKIFRQLRIGAEEFKLRPQRQSRIVFNGCSLGFSNDIDLLKTEIGEKFPLQVDAFCNLCEVVDSEFRVILPGGWDVSALEILPQYISDPFLIKILLLPLLYYGSSQENDISWNQFVVLFKSIFLEGLARPCEGIRLILRILKDRYKSLGGVRRMKCGVRQIRTRGDGVDSLVLDDGSVITADHVISSIGYPETLRLCLDRSGVELEENVGKLSFVETITVMKGEPRALGWEETIIFFNDTAHLEYRCPDGLVSTNSGVICIPNNYDYGDLEGLEEGYLRITALASYDLWSSLNEEEYREQKEIAFNKLQGKALEYLPFVDSGYFKEITLACDMFTPRTIARYTGRLGGAVYGAIHKNFTGETHLKNLYICGTDQGFLGVTGSMMSGIAMANKHVLARFE